MPYPEQPAATSASSASTILTLFQANPTQTYTLRQCYKHLHALDRRKKQAIQAALQALVQAGRIASLSKGRYALPAESAYAVGSVDYVHAEYAYIITPTADILVKQPHLRHALHKDRVQVVVMSQNKKKTEGRVVAILERNPSPWVGRIVQQGKTVLALVEHKRMPVAIAVDPADRSSVQLNDKVVIQVIDWPLDEPYPRGKIQRVLGPAGLHAVEMHAILAEFGLPVAFPPAVLAAAQQLPAAIPVHELTRRKDFRSVCTFTIDPADAQDFDDALSYRPLPNGHVEVGIHIADVSYYVPENSPIEEEAYKRGTSVYLVDRTVPMLPERLATALCSLTPHEDKLTFSAVFELDAQGKIHNEWFGETVIHSDQRFTYETAQEVLTLQQGEFAAALQVLNQLAHQLRTQRFQQGAIHFETTALTFQLDPAGKPLHVFPQKRLATHHLIEEFMLLANQRVATYVYQKKKDKTLPVFIYRTHDRPDPVKWQDFLLLAKQLGYSLNPAIASIVATLNQLMATVAGRKEENMLQTLAIRTMAKARYTTEAQPHFALAFPHYTHFTSPIRRYPDVMVHRLLKHYLKGCLLTDASGYPEKCTHALARELIAAEAERASIKYKQVELIQGMQKQVFEGVISGVTAWGLFIEIGTYLGEGMVRLEDLTDDYYVLEAQPLRLIGKRTKKIYKIGDIVLAQVKRCNIHRRTIELVLVARQRVKHRKKR